MLWVLATSHPLHVIVLNLDVGIIPPDRKDTQFEIWQLQPEKPLQKTIWSAKCMFLNCPGPIQGYVYHLWNPT